MLNRTIVDTIREKTEDVTKAQTFANELLRTAQDRYGERNIVIKGAEGEAETTESEAWGNLLARPMFADDYRDALKLVHSDVFTAFQKQNEAAEDLTKYVNTEVGVDMNRMRITDYLTMTEQMFQMLTKEGEAKK